MTATVPPAMPRTAVGAWAQGPPEGTVNATPRISQTENPPPPERTETSSQISETSSQISVTSSQTIDEFCKLQLTIMAEMFSYLACLPPAEGYPDGAVSLLLLVDSHPDLESFRETLGAKMEERDPTLVTKMDELSAEEAAKTAAARKKETEDAPQERPMTRAFAKQSESTVDLN